MISSVAFRNFKALRAASLTLGPFNLFIGPNGSGKTSLIQALLRLRTLSRLPLADPQAASEAAKQAGPEIAFRFSPPHAGIAARLGCISDYACDLLVIAPADAPGWPALRADISGIRTYLFDYYAMAEPAPLSSGTVLASNGGNLAAVLAAFAARAPEAFAAMSAELVRIMPEFAGFEITPGDTAAFTLRLVDGERVSADNLSQGTLHTIAILALAFDPGAASVICIEEIDRGVHPRMLREIRDALYRLSHPQASGMQRRPVQVIATTHSPYLLDLFRDHPEEIVIAQKHGTEARFERLVDRPDLAELLQEGSLGDMWFSGVLGGVPEER